MIAPRHDHGQGARCYLAERLINQRDLKLVRDVVEVIAVCNKHVQFVPKIARGGYGSFFDQVIVAEIEYLYAVAQIYGTEGKTFFDGGTLILCIVDTFLLPPVES